MKRQEIAHHERLEPQKPSARETPHFVLEANTTCNIRCAYCYVIDQPAVKPLADVRAEIDLAFAKRNLDSVSILGGEPTIHPEIVEIVEYIKAKGLTCTLLTNGVRFVRDHDEALLDRLVEAGVDRFVVHMDSGQKHVHGDIDAAREQMFSMLDARHINYGLSITMYPNEEETLAPIIKRYAKHAYFDGVLCTLAFDLPHALDLHARPQQRPSLARLYRSLSADLGVEPAAYLPSSRDDDEVCWLMYFYYLNVETGAAFALSPEVNRAFRALYRKVKGRNFFAEVADPKWLPLSVATMGTAEIARHPTRLPELSHLLQHAGSMKNLRFHYILIQNGPVMDRAHGRVDVCWNCPDATIRNGKLTPVCIAGQLNPLGPYPVTAPPEIIRDVFDQIGEH